MGWEGKSALADFGVVGEGGGGQLSALPNSSGMTFTDSFLSHLCFRFSTLANIPHALLKEKIAAITGRLVTPLPSPVAFLLLPLQKLQ